MVSKRHLRGTEPLGYVKPLGLPDCPLCGRPLVAGPSVDEHHLVPKSQGGKTKSLIHKICHRKIHANFSEKELATSFFSWQALRQHPDIAAFVQWLANKPPTFYDNSRKPAKRR